MIPFKDDNPTRRFPFFTITIITLNVFCFLIELFHPAGIRYIIFHYGAIPKHITTFHSTEAIHPFFTIFSSMFLHGGLFHLGGNMLYLWIFGNNIEDRLGHFRFLLFYMLSGIFAAYGHAITEPGSTIPMVGASGAVSGILGAYLLLFPQARVHTLVFFGFFIDIIKIPALIVIGFWAVIQFLNGLMSKGLMAQGGVAWFAHIGGFLFGLFTIKLWLPRRKYVSR